MATLLVKPPNAALVLADGAVFSGYGIGATGITVGEICFNTAMTGYQEVLTDPSYFGQIITFTFPHIGNIGTNAEDIESLKPVIAGLVLREPITEPSNFRATAHLDAWLKQHHISGISGVDTRAITRHIRNKGAQNAAIVIAKNGAPDITAAKEALLIAPDMNGLELAAKVSTKKHYGWEESAWELGKGYGKGGKGLNVVALDFGEKHNILRSLTHYGCNVTTVPGNTSADEILKMKPDGVFLSNGPGDPAATAKYAVPTIQKLIAQDIPVFGICLGHQLLALALGAITEKMKQGHRGANHPVKDLTTGKVEITSQNHGFCVCEANLPKNVTITHRSLFDNCIEGIALKDKPVFSVQYHPESSPGPHDSMYLFQRFVDLMQGGKKKAA